MRNTLELHDRCETRVFPNRLLLGKKIWLLFKVGNRIQSLAKLLSEMWNSNMGQIKDHKCIYLSAEALLKSYDFQELVLPT